MLYVFYHSSNISLRTSLPGSPRPPLGETGHQESNCLKLGSPPISDALSILLSPLLLSSLMRTQTSTEVEEQEVRP